VTNAVQHTKGPAAIRLPWSDPVLRVGVWDADPRPPVPAPRIDAALNPTFESGRGLTLVERCSDNWGWYALGTATHPPDGDGKFIWCELPRAA
jgi:hypothetical protein